MPAESDFRRRDSTVSDSFPAPMWSPANPRMRQVFHPDHYCSVGAEKIHNCCSGRLYHYRATIRPSQCGARLWAKSRFPKCLRILRSDSQEGTDSSLCDWVFAAAANAYCVAVKWACSVEAIDVSKLLFDSKSQYSRCCANWSPFW